jgi:class 3 adenylate cyclase
VKKSVEVESVVRRFLEARVAMDMEAMRSLHSDSEFLRLIATDDDWIQGHSAVLPAGGRIGDPDDWAGKWAVKDSSILRIEAFEEGAVGWAAAEQERTLVSGVTFALRVTMVLRLESSVWKVIQLHFSTAVPDDEADFEPIDLPQTLSDLLDSLDGDIAHEAMSRAGLATATVMFTDVVDSTTLSKEMGDEGWSETISEHFGSVKAIVEEQGGMQIKTLGDGGMYVFPSATSAVRGAIGVQRLVDSGDDRFDLRIGVHTGDLIPNEGDVVGLTVNKAARIAATAAGGQILVSETTNDIVGPQQFDFDLPIRAELKGLDGTHSLHPLRW